MRKRTQKLRPSRPTRTSPRQATEEEVSRFESEGGPPKPETEQKAARASAPVRHKETDS